MTLPHARILEKVGAHRVIFPEHEMGVRLGNALAGTNLIDYMELDPRYAVAEIRCPVEIAGRTLAEANVRGRYGVIVLCIKSGDEVDVIPEADRRLEKSDMIVVAGPTKDIDRLGAVDGARRAQSQRASLNAAIMLPPSAADRDRDHPEAVDLALPRHARVHAEQAGHERQRQEQHRQHGQDPQDPVLALVDDRLVRALQRLRDFLVVVEHVPDALGGVDEVVVVDLEVLGQEPRGVALQQPQRRDAAAS